MTTVAELPAGFADKVLSAQSTFRSVMDAMARPGSVQRIAAAAGAPAAMMRGTAAIALTLFDHDTPVWLDRRGWPATPDVAKWLKFHTSAPVVADSSISSFALIGDPQSAAGARSLRVRQQRISGSFDDADPAGREPDAGPCVRAARPRHRRHGDAARFDRSRVICSSGWPSTPRCFRAASMSCWFMTMPSSRYRARRGWREGRLTMYVAVKGGERAIENAHRLLAHERRGDRDVPELSLAQISEQLSLGVDRVMTEGSLYDRELAALAIKQARGDLIEAIFLVRAFRATLPRFGATEPVDTGAMQVRRRISSTFKDIPGGQILGPTFDYTHRLLDPQLAEGFAPEAPATGGGVRRGDAARHRHSRPRRPDRAVAAVADADAPVGDLTREPLSFPGRPRSAPAKSGARRRRLSAGARLFDAARLWPQPSLRRRNPLRRGRGRIHGRGCRLCRAARLDRADRMPDGQPVQGLGDRSAVLHARLWPGLRAERAQDHVDGAGRSHACAPANSARK